MVRVAIFVMMATGNKTITNLRRKIMSILKLRANLVEKIKDFGSSFHPVFKKPLEELSLPIKNMSDSLTRILSIDDNQICQKINVNHLEKLGCMVECVNSARSALEKLTLSYQVIFLDVNLPDCSIDVLVNLIRSDEGNVNQTTPIVLTSSWLNEAFKQHYLALGVDEVYIKPMQEKDFKKILQNHGVYLKS
jgi:CheY-like chemotaxis protein